MEFAAQMTCQKCVDAISNSLHGKEGISESYGDAMVCFTCFNNQDASQKVHVPEIDCSAKANYYSVYVLYREEKCYLTYPW